MRTGAVPESKIDALRRRFSGSAEVQTLHSQATTGTPVEVPLPRTVAVTNQEFSNFSIASFIAS